MRLDAERLRRSSCAGSRRTPRRRSGRPAKSMPHTWSRISAFDATLPSLRMRNSSSANSRAVSRIVGARRAGTRRAPGSSSRSPTVSTVGRGGAPRRISARSRASEHDERERLRQEVVGAGVERLGLVVLAVLGGEHQDRRPDAFVAQRAAHLVAVHARAGGRRARWRRRSPRGPARGRRGRCGRRRRRSPRR